MELEGSILCLQELVPGLYPELNDCSWHPSTLFLLRSILVLSSHPHLRLPSGLFQSDFPAKTLYEFLISSMHAICPANIIIDLIMPVIGESTNYETTHYSASPVFCFFIFGTNILLSTLICNVRNQIFTFHTKQ